MSDTNIEQLIDAIAAGDFTSAEAMFGDLMSDRIADSLEAERIAVAATVYGVPELEDEDENGDDTDENDDE